MLPRMIAALVGGSAITIAILLGMHEATRHFKDLDPTRYFSVVDFIAAPDRSRRPTPPPAPGTPPERASVGFEPGDEATLPYQRPVLEQERSRTTAPRPALDAEFTPDPPSERTGAAGE